MKIAPITYSYELQNIIKRSHQLDQGLSEVEVIGYISKLAKIDVMDMYIDHHADKVTSPVIYEAISQAFGFHLERVPVLTKVKIGTFEIQSSTDLDTFNSSPSQIILDLYLAHHHYHVTGDNVRTMINHYFGMNLAGIDGLGKTKISLYSKGQWLVKDEKDLFVIHTGTKDVDVKIYGTNYFMKRTGSKNLPTELQRSLTDMGYSYNPKLDAYYYSNPSGLSVSNAFKGKTIDAIIDITNALYKSI
ncbi:hypothetical protein CSV80_15190 [Sporosarcina sp. P12(2017)]|uniref:hypothetical protein n=1 Tax=unclassified Sporosarcina TaxID=2647733 RepID=UPI000C17152C|nr:MULTISPECIES: hypothetical protein [unclassified Sporosarcina]PIC56107.1 hypothetical protein CSV81_16035 [Sporosarcina sp. P10]PIC59616.1 hypothetical protein CSV80_15190 [Sporosarcina sp. P12(2017)]